MIDYLTYNNYLKKKMIDYLTYNNNKKHDWLPDI